MSDPDALTVKRRQNTRAQLQLMARNYPDAWEYIFDVLHFTGPCQNERDMALQNAAKSILHAAGWWGDSETDRVMVMGKLSGLGRRRSRWERFKDLFRR